MGTSRRALVSVQLSPSERVVVHDAARRARLTVSNYLRRCINIALADEADGRVVEEKPTGRPPILFTPAHVARMRYFRDCGLTIRQIAQRMDCSTGLVCKRMRETIRQQEAR